MPHPTKAGILIDLDFYKSRAGKHSCCELPNDRPCPKDIVSKESFPNLPLFLTSLPETWGRRGGCWLLFYFSFFSLYSFGSLFTQLPNKSYMEVYS